MIRISSQLKYQFIDQIREIEKRRCENAVRNHYSFIDDLNPYEIAEHLPDTINLLTDVCLNSVRTMFDRLEKDSIGLEGHLAIQKNDTLTHIDILDSDCSIFGLEFLSGAHIVYKDAPSDSYELWEFSAEKTGLSAMKNLCFQDYLYSEYTYCKPLAEDHSPHEYFYNLGKILTLAHLFGAGDFHGGNLYAVDNMPVIIDCDMLFHLGKPYWRIAASGCFAYDDGGDYKKPAQTASLFQGHGCPYTQDGSSYLFEDYTEDVKQGYWDCAKNSIPLLHDDFMEKAPGMRYRYLPMKEERIRKLFDQRIVFGQREPKSTSPIVQNIMKSINALKQPKFFSGIDDGTLCYGDAPICEVASITSELLEYRFTEIPTDRDIAIQFEDIENTAELFRAER